MFLSSSSVLGIDSPEGKNGIICSRTSALASIGISVSEVSTLAKSTVQHKHIILRLQKACIRTTMSQRINLYWYGAQE